MNYLPGVVLVNRLLYVLFQLIALSPSDVLSYLKFLAIAGFTVLCWDHTITFADEVRSVTNLSQ
jgi:hypothetical protein